MFKNTHIEFFSGWEKKTETERKTRGLAIPHHWLKRQIKREVSDRTAKDDPAWLIKQTSNPD